MANPKEEEEAAAAAAAADADATTEDEIQGTASKPKDAFTALMSPKKPKQTAPKATNHQHQHQHHHQQPPNLLTDSDQRNLNLTHGRAALKVYTQTPHLFPPTRVIASTPDFVLINDLYPKSTIHLLLLPRNPHRQEMHPYDALDGTDAAFLASVQAETARVRKLAASELRRRFSQFSASDRARNEALKRGESGGKVPEGRDWEASIVSGVHAHPSMSDLHVHVMSVDRVSECMRNRRHYNSFATGFLVPVEDVPLGKEDVRRHPGRAGFLDEELKCWRCGKEFGRKFARLRDHLEEEFEEWKKE